MIDIGQAILELETLNKSFDIPLYEIGVAVKALKMWRQLEKDYGRFDLKEKDGMSDIPLVARMKGIENTYFPSLIHQTIKVSIQGKDDKAIQHIRKRIRDTWGVREVWS